MRNTRLLIMFLSTACLVALQPTVGKSVQHKRSSGRAQAAQSDVVVTKNADGTVEASDADASPTAKPGVTYKAAPPATIRYGDGVVVKRNADGSVDVTDEDSVHPVMHSLGAPSAPAAHPKHHATTHSASKSGLKPAGTGTAKPAPQKKK